MDFLSHPVIAVILLLGALIFFHELGHFLVGKAFGIGVEIFSIGFGPIIASWQRSETNYRISLIPLGGFVKFYGSVPWEDVPPQMEGREFHRASVFARMCTVAAGPIANFLLAIVVLAMVGFHGIKQPPAVVGQILEDSPASRAGLEFQDKIVAINGKQINTWRDMQRAIEASPGESLVVRVERNSETIDLEMIPESVDDSELARQKGRIGISPYHVPAVITVVDTTAEAAKLGMQTGMRIVSLEASGITKKVDYWLEIEKLWPSLEFSESSPLIIEAYLVDPELSEEQRTETELLRFVVAEKKASFASTLGVDNAQLTVAKLVEPLDGLEIADQLVTWQGKPIGDAVGLSQIISKNTEPVVSLGLIRKGELIEQLVSLKAVDVQRAEGKVTLYTLPVEFWGPLEQAPAVLEAYPNPLEAVAYGIKETAYIMETVTGAVIGLITGNVPLKALGGPIAIAKVASDSVKLGWQTFLIAMAWLSVNLGLLNLVPIPVLDGGQLVLLGAEAGLRRPLSSAVVEGFQKVGFVMVMALVLMATYNDLGRFWASMLEGMGSLF